MCCSAVTYVCESGVSRGPVVLGCFGWAWLSARCPGNCYQKDSTPNLCCVSSACVHPRTPKLVFPEKQSLLRVGAATCQPAPSLAFAFCVEQSCLCKIVATSIKKSALGKKFHVLGHGGLQSLPECEFISFPKYQRRRHKPVPPSAPMQSPKRGFKTDPKSRPKPGALPGALPDALSGSGFGHKFWACSGLSKPSSKKGHQLLMCSSFSIMF